MSDLTPMERKWLTEAIAALDAALARHAPVITHRFPDDDRRADVVQSVARYIVAGRIRTTREEGRA